MIHQLGERNLRLSHHSPLEKNMQSDKDLCSWHTPRERERERENITIHYSCFVFPFFLILNLMLLLLFLFTLSLHSLTSSHFFTLLHSLSPPLCSCSSVTHRSFNSTWNRWAFFNSHYLHKGTLQFSTSTTYPFEFWFSLLTC